MCQITITSNSVFKVGDRLRVSGTVEGCVPVSDPDADPGTIIKVDFECNGNVISDFPDVNSDGSWYASVLANDCDCPAQGDPPQMVTVTVTCLNPLNPETCMPLPQNLPLICVDGCIVATNGPGEDDVFKPEIDWFCENGPHAVVTFKFWLENNLPFDAFVKVDNPKLVSITPSNPALVPPGAFQQIQISVTVETPLTSPDDIFTFYYVDSSNVVIPCPGFSATNTIENSCCPVNEAPRIEVATDGCTVTASWDSSLVPEGCHLQFDFKDPTNPSPQTSNEGDSSKTFTYSSDGSYENLSVYVKCDNGCSGNPRLFGPVNIVGCPDEDAPDPSTESEPESLACRASRIAAIVTFAMAIFVAALSWCLGDIALLKGAGVLAVISVIIWLIYYFFCATPCGVGKLSTAEGLIAAGLALLVYSGCCTWQFVSAGLLLLGIGLYLFYKWKDDCNYSNCYAWGELALLGTFITAYLFFILDLFPGVSACKASIISWNNGQSQVDASAIVALVTAFTVAKVVACVQDEAPEVQPPTID